MKRVEGSFELTATDLVGYLNCHHLSELERAVAEEKLAKPKVFDPLLEVLRERGFRHEQSYIEHLKHAGLDVVRIDGIDVGDGAVSETIAAMKQGAPVIAQGALARQGWAGRADILRRVEIPSALGEWSYEAIDTKLSRQTKAGAVLQLCLYSDLLTQTQGAAPEHMHVVAPWSDFKPRTYRFADYAAYFREVKRGLGATLAEQETEETYPDPKTHCDICRWREECDERRRADDHLCLVAGISKIQINELKQRGITTMKALAGMALPLNWKPDRGSIDACGSTLAAFLSCGCAPVAKAMANAASVISSSNRIESSSTPACQRQLISDRLAAVACSHCPPCRLFDGVNDEPHRPVHKQDVHAAGVIAEGRHRRP